MSTRPSPCPICTDNAAADAGTEPWTVARLETGYVRLNPNQYFPGATFFVSTACVHELFELAGARREKHLNEMTEVAAAIFSSFSPKKMNYEALGNGVPHLHWWLTPRYATDPRGFAPIWEDLEFLRAQWTGGRRPDDKERVALGRQLLGALKARGLTIEQSYF
jgi:diadenosine tetraphosphate (Ap4A) HIT family hydrolase